jgi:hypothetical protein
LVNYGDPDPADDKEPSVHEIKDDAIHNEDIQHSSSSTGASCFFSVQISCHTFLSIPGGEPGETRAGGEARVLVARQGRKS